MTGCYEHGDEHSDFIESGKVLFNEQLSSDGEQPVDSRPKQLLLLGLTLAQYSLWPLRAEP
jgi:hypothetical protein